MSLAFAQLAVGAFLASAVVSLAADRHPALLRIFAFALLGIGGGCAAFSGAWALFTPVPQERMLALGLPWLQWHMRLDPLSGLFLLTLGIVTVAVACYGPGYAREYRHRRQSLSVLGFFTGLFVAGMALVLLADDAFFFMVSWELMSLSSYFLVAYQHQHAANRRAAFLYLLMAHVGALAILLAFGILAGVGGDFTFAAMRAHPLAPLWASAAFALAFLGFGMKAGLVPLHAWLPEAHPVAPSHVSALMSGVMLKVAVYGLIRVVYDLLGSVHWGWGLAMLCFGAASALLGVLYAFMQQDLKRLLAYSSVENVGVIFIALGLSVIFLGTGQPALAALGLIAALYHSFNHALFKSLLFLGAGSVLQRSHEHSLERMGGLIRRMPQTAALFLVGSLGIASLPPLNGFVSEWLTFQTALQATQLQSGVLRSLVPIAAALLALTAALGAATFVKTYGVAFLGKARSRRVRHAREAALGMRIGMGLLAALCILAGLLPTFLLQTLSSIPGQLLGTGLGGAESNWLWLSPVSRTGASYAALAVLAAIAAVWLLTYWLLRSRRRDPGTRTTPAWDCGFGLLTPRMQYTSASFSMPIRRIFRPVWEIHEQVETTQDNGHRVQAIRHQLHINDRSWNLLYEPIVRLVQHAAKRVSRIQTGSIRIYLTYSFFTLLILLWLIT